MGDALTLEALTAKREVDLAARERVEAAVVLVALRGGEPYWTTIRKARALAPSHESGERARQLVSEWVALVRDVCAVLLGGDADNFTVEGRHLADRAWHVARKPALLRHEACLLSDGLSAALPTLCAECSILVDWRGGT